MDQSLLGARLRFRAPRKTSRLTTFTSVTICFYVVSLAKSVVFRGPLYPESAISVLPRYLFRDYDNPCLSQEARDDFRRCIGEFILNNFNNS